jgi:hypothetical protein
VSFVPTFDPPRPLPPKPGPRPKFPVPWGLFIVLAVYALAVWGYIWKTYWTSDEYLALQAYKEAMLRLGVKEGETCSEADFLIGFDKLLEAARLMPEERELLVKLERLRYLAEQRKFKLSKEQVRHVEMMALRAKNIAEERKPWLVVGTRDKGWAPDQLAQTPQRIVWWSIPGGLVIIAFWGYLQFSARRVRAQEHEADLKKAEREVEELGEFRRGLGVSKSSLPPVEDDDGDTEAEPPKPRPGSSSGRPAVSRPATTSGAKAVSRPPTSGVKPVSRPPTASSAKAVSRPGTSGSRPAVKRRPPDEE